MCISQWIFFIILKLIFITIKKGGEIVKVLLKASAYTVETEKNFFYLLLIDFSSLLYANDDDVIPLRVFILFLSSLFHHYF